MSNYSIALLHYSTANCNTRIIMTVWCHFLVAPRVYGRIFLRLVVPMIQAGRVPPQIKFCKQVWLQCEFMAWREYRHSTLECCLHMFCLLWLDSSVGMRILWFIQPDLSGETRELRALRLTTSGADFRMCECIVWPARLACVSLIAHPRSQVRQESDLEVLLRTLDFIVSYWTANKEEEQPLRSSDQTCGENICISPSWFCLACCYNLPYLTMPTTMSGWEKRGLLVPPWDLVMR